EDRKTTVEMVKAVARQINIPFTIGGGINSIADAEVLLQAGADKISINSAAIRRPGLIDELAATFGDQFVVVAVDTRRHGSEQRVYLNGGRILSEHQTQDWLFEAQERGAGEILLTSMDQDGTREGFDIPFLKAVNEKLNIPLIASGGAGKVEDFVAVFLEAGVDAALAASVFHFGQIAIPALKSALADAGVPVRLD
ncbi:MAG TPA: imidazole glycerol phosphate synthase cyclase subunit, partial [Sphingobacteriaceae bacterium]|nr:imidazole glycerol phosphate synthase cyclase subunit [Sphingobacteriaceae bacterium]